jgi:ribose transport system substrate-binding protein
MTHRIQFMSGAVALAVLAGLTGCGSPPHLSTEKYFLVATNVKIQYWQEAGAGMVKAARDLGVQAEMVGPDSYDPKLQKEEFAKTVAKKPAGILVSPGDPGLLVDDINAAIQAGIPVITIDSDAPQSKRLVFVGTNNYQAGLTGGRLVVKKLNGKGNVVVFTIQNQANVAERLHGYQDAFAAAPGIKIVEVVDVHGDPRIAFDKTTEIVDKQKDKVDAFVSLEALSGSEVAEVLDRKKVEGKLVVAMDTMPTTLDWIDKGKIAATVSQKPFTMAYFGIRMLGDLKLTKLPSLTINFAQDPRSPLPAFVDTGSALVDKSNLAEFRKDTAATN